MSNDYQVIFSGEGGQGLVLAGTILAEAAAIFEGKYATQTVDYGIASRGGFAMSEVKISDEEIDCPELIEPDYIVALTEDAFNRFEKEAGKSVIIFDSDAFSPALEGDNIKGCPFTTTLRRLAEEYGNKARINVLAIGAVLGLKEIISLQAMRKVFEKNFGAKNADINMKVLQAGIEMTRS